ncbi:hypothetical protein ACUY2R_05120 [Corynebacterium mastitidis]
MILSAPSTEINKHYLPQQLLALTCSWVNTDQVTEALITPHTQRPGIPAATSHYFFGFSPEQLRIRLRQRGLLPGTGRVVTPAPVLCNAQVEEPFMEAVHQRIASRTTRRAV